MNKTFTIGIILGGITVLSPSVSLSQTAYANYKGRSINLTQSWEGAKACVVASGKINCFDSYTEADRFTGSSAPAQANTPRIASCSRNGWTYVYDGRNFTGRRLQFSDSGKWQSYYTYGFQNKQESWNNPRCGRVYLYDDATGLPYYIEDANTKSQDMGSWNNRADHIWIAP
jgi:hypothetical protein